MGRSERLANVVSGVERGEERRGSLVRLKLAKNDATIHPVSTDRSGREIGSPESWTDRVEMETSGRRRGVDQTRPGLTTK